MALGTPTTVEHRCVPRRKHRGFMHHLIVWGLLPLHLICVVLVVIVTIKYLNGKKFLTGPIPSLSNFDSELGWLFLKDQSDVTTVFTVALVLVRLISSAWNGIAAWRCAFLLLERNGLSLKELSSMVQLLRLPAHAQIFRPRKNPNRNLWLLCTTALILLLGWPAQLAAPLAQGSIKWVPDQIWEDIHSGVFFPLASPSAWTINVFRNNEATRKYYSDRAAGKAFLAASAMTGDPPRIPVAMGASSLYLDIDEYPAGTKIRDITLPAFEIESFSWVDEVEPFRNALNEEIKGGRLKEYTSNNIQLVPRPNMTEDPKWVTLKPDTATLFSGTKHAIIFWDLQYKGVRGENDRCHIDPSWKNTPTHFIEVPWDQSDVACFAIAEFSVAAGVIDCTDYTCALIGRGVIAPVQSTLGSKPQIKPHPLVEPAVIAMSTTINAMSSMDTFQGRLGVLKSSNAELITRAVLTMSYQASWSSLNDEFAVGFPGENQSRVETPVWKPHVAVRADITAWRMWVWGVLQLVVVVCGVVLICLEEWWGVEGRVVDPVLRAVMLDNSELLAYDESGLCNAVEVGEKDEKLGLLRLVREEGGKIAHSRLVPSECVWEKDGDSGEDV